MNGWRLKSNVFVVEDLMKPSKPRVHVPCHVKSKFYSALIKRFVKIKAKDDTGSCNKE